MRKKTTFQKIISVCVVLVAVAVIILTSRKCAEISAQHESIILRTGDDKKIMSIVDLADIRKKMIIIKRYQWNTCNYNLFDTRYSTYCKTITAIITVTLKRESFDEVTALFKTKILEFIVKPDVVNNYDIFRFLVWGLLRLEGKDGYMWLKNVIDKYKYKDKNGQTEIIVYGNLLLWLDYINYNNYSVPKFLRAIHVEGYDQEWSTRFYFAYCDNYQISGFSSSEEWCSHIKLHHDILRDMILIKNDTKVKPFLGISSAIIYNAVCNENIEPCSIKYSYLQ